jgi:hypothetical protein
MIGNKIQRMTGFEVMRDSAGNIHQAGIPSDPINRHRSIDLVEIAPVEAVVESVYYTDEDDRNGHTKNHQRTVMVDVRTLGRLSQQIRWVPVAQRTQGLWDEDIVIPRPTKLDIDGNDLSAGSAAKGDKRPTPAESMDGDRGLLFFLESNPAKPLFIPYSQGHPKTNSPRTSSGGRVKRLRHAGVLMEWSEDGNWTLDATTAAKQELAADGSEQSNLGTGGIVTIKTKDGAGGELHLVLDETGLAELQATNKVTITAPLIESIATNKVAASAQLIELEATVQATVDAPIVGLGTIPREPVIKGAAYSSAESSRVAASSAAATSTGTLFVALAALPPLLAVKPLLEAAGQSMLALAQANSTFLAAASASLSTKVSTG